MKIIYNIKKFHDVQMFKNRGSVSICIMTRKSNNSQTFQLSVLKMSEIGHNLKSNTFLTSAFNDLCNFFD